jgi:hypothetical protein
MRTVVSQGRVICLVTVMFVLGSLVVGMAEPSPACRALAKQFAETPEKLSPDNLFRLQACVRRELGHRGVDDPSDVQPSTPKYPRVPGLSPPSGG